ncbi:MAG: methyltransferase [Candidatus Ranarchaeia archaeon]
MANMLPYLNIISLALNLVLVCIVYTISIQPIRMVESRGQKAWRECYLLREFSTVFLTIAVINLVLWLFIPIPELNFSVHTIPQIAWIISGVIAIPCLTLVILGIKDAGKETVKPSPETKMYKGIYHYIRHPQTVGEFPLFIAISFALNSWFLVIITTLFITIYIPIMIHYEEKDLIKRFGKPYQEYQKNTGAIFPKLRKKHL